MSILGSFVEKMQSKPSSSEWVVPDPKIWTEPHFYQAKNAFFVDVFTVLFLCVCTCPKNHGGAELGSAAGHNLWVLWLLRRGVVYGVKFPP